MRWNQFALSFLAVAVAIPFAGCRSRRCCPTVTTPACAPVVAATPCDPCTTTPVVAGCSDEPTPPPNDRPPSANPGEAWCRVWIPPQYEEKSHTVCVAPAGKKKIWVAPVYGTRVKLECVSGPEINERTTPAQFGSRKVQIRQPGKTRCVCTKDECGCPTRAQVTDPDTFRTECERICLQPERTCFEFKPAQYQAVQERFLIKPGFCQEQCTPPRYETKTTRVCVRPGKWEWRRNVDCEVPMEEPLAALQVELVDQKPSGVEAGIFKVGETVRYNLKVSHDDGSTGMKDLKVIFTLPPELKFVSGTGNGVSVTGTAQNAESGVFQLAIGEVKELQVMAQVVSVSPTNMIQMIASVQGSDGAELARETESTTTVE